MVASGSPAGGAVLAGSVKSPSGATQTRNTSSVRKTTRTCAGGAAMAAHAPSTSIPVTRPTTGVSDMATLCHQAGGPAGAGGGPGAGGGAAAGGGGGVGGGGRGGGGLNRHRLPGGEAGPAQDGAGPTRPAAP